MKALNESQARRCEEAKGGRCRCRCGGAMHGASRAKLAGDTPRTWFEALPEDDPHKVRELSAAEQARRAKADARQKTRRSQLVLALDA